MKSSTVIILWLLAVVLGVTSYFVKFHSDEEAVSRTKLAPGDRLFANLPVREIYAVTLKEGGNITHLVRDEKNEWGVKERDGYTINYLLLRDLLGSLNSLEITQGYPTSEEYFTRFGLADEIAETDKERGYLGAIKVTMMGKDGNTLAEIALGKYSGSSRVGGRFVRITGDDSGVYAVAQTFPGVTAEPKDWLGKDFLKIGPMQTIAVTAPSDSSFTSWELSRSTDRSQFSLVGMKANELMKIASTNAFRNFFGYSAFRDVLNDEQAAQLSEPDHKLKRSAIITTSAGLIYQLDFWPHKELPKDPDADPRLPPLARSYNLVIKASANFPETRTKTADEKPEDTQKLDQQFIELRKAAEQRLTIAKSFEGRIFQISEAMISPLQKQRSDFVTTKTEPSTSTPPLEEPSEQ